jgi:hypothetical protein
VLRICAVAPTPDLDELAEVTPIRKRRSSA